MKRTFSILAIEVGIAGCLFGQMTGMHHTTATAPVDNTPRTHRTDLTFTKDVAPIVQAHCQSCHRPGEGTPFSLLTYESAKPWAKDIKKMVETRAMPPWFDDGTTEKFENKRSLTQDQINTIVDWVNSGAPKGDPKDMPAPLSFVEGWTIPKPDVVYQLPHPFSIPATGVMQYQYVIIPSGFTKDTWVQDVEAAPTDRSVVHHIVAYVRAPGSNYFKDMPKNVFFEAPPKTDGKPAPKGDVPNDWLVGYAPGQPPDMFKPGQAKLIPANSDIVLEVHYMPEGKATTDQSRLGLVLAKDPPLERTMTLSAGNEKLAIPPNDPNYRVDASYTIPQDMTLLGMHPHMHTRGKSAQYRLVFPNGETKTVLNVPRYNWHWQLWYNLEQPIKLPKGTKLECTEHFDNSKDNPENPDPNRTVPWGQQSTDEMMVCMFNVAFPSTYTTKDILSPSKEDKAAKVDKASIEPAAK
jgi:Copper type II ascorbate-dependent monooxygenase, C-terminal domain